MCNKPNKLIKPDYPTLHFYQRRLFLTPNQPVVILISDKHVEDFQPILIMLFLWLFIARFMQTVAFYCSSDPAPTEIANEFALVIISNN